MSSQRQHELQQNELANVLDRVNQSIDPYSKPIAIGVGIVMAAFLGWGFYSTAQSDQRSDATFELINASVSNDAETLATVAARYPKTSAAAWSRLYQGSSKLAAGINSLFDSRVEAEELLGEAGAAYEEAIKLSKDTVIRSRSYYGIAQAAESLGDVEKAVKNYEQVIAVGESDAMVQFARQRIDLLSKGATADFLAWFAEQDFSPAEAALPPSLPGAGELPDLPDVDLPEVEATPVEDTADSSEGEPSPEAAAESEQTTGAPSEPEAAPSEEEKTMPGMVMPEIAEEAVESEASSQPAMVEEVEEKPESEAGQPDLSEAAENKITDTEPEE